MKALVVTLVVLSSATTAAQVRVVRYGDDRLTGIEEVDVLIRLASPVHTQCPVSVADLRQRAIANLATRNIKATISEKARSWHYSIVVEVRSASTGGGCASAIVTELVAEVAGMPEGDTLRPPGAWGSLLIWFMPLRRDNTLVIGSALEHDAAVQRSVDEHVAAIAAAIRTANP